MKITLSESQLHKQLEQSLSFSSVLFNSNWLLGYLSKVQPLLWLTNRWKHVSSRIREFLSGTVALDYILAINQISYISEFGFKYILLSPSEYLSLRQHAFWMIIQNDFCYLHLTLRNNPKMGGSMFSRFNIK